MSSVILKIIKLASNGGQSSILKCVRDNLRISRSGIAGYLGLPRSAVSRTVTSLLEEQKLIEIPLADATGPRRKHGLSLNPNLGYGISVSYAPDGIEGCIIDTAYNVLEKESRKIKFAPLPTQDKLAEIISFIEKLKSKIHEPIEKCLALVVVDPGVIDEQAGVSQFSSIMENWTNVPIVRILEEKFHLPVMLTVDGVAEIRAIDRLELNSTFKNLLFINYSEGIGCSLKLQGKYIAGHNNLAGEFGHSRVANQDILCQCGGVGCLEAVTALCALVRNVEHALEEGSKSVLADCKSFDGYDVLAAAKEDRLASRIVYDAYDCLGQYVAILINTLAPEMVMFNNTTGIAGDDAVSALFQSIKRNTLHSHSKNLKLQISTLKSHISCLGGAVGIIDYCLEY